MIPYFRDRGEWSGLCLSLPLFNLCFGLLFKVEAVPLVREGGQWI